MIVWFIPVKNPKHLDTSEIAAIILKPEQCGFKLEKCIQKVQTEP